jgi:hypothetical protein
MPDSSALTTPDAGLTRACNWRGRRLSMLPASGACIASIQLVIGSDRLVIGARESHKRVAASASHDV